MTNLQTSNEDYTGRWTSPAELDAEGQQCDMPPATDGYVELLDESGAVVADEWVRDIEAAQAWLDSCDIEELDPDQEEYEPDFDPFAEVMR